MTSKKVKIDRETCIGCGACGATASDLFYVPPGQKSLFKKDFVVIDKETNNEKYKVVFNDKIKVLDLNGNLVKEFENNEEGLNHLSEFLGEKVILIRDIEKEIEESAEMGENVCPVSAIKRE
jgi:ferredoxin